MGDDSGNPLSLSLFAIAEKFFEYYWRQTLPYSTADVLRQNTGRPASIISLILRRRAERGDSLPSVKRDRHTWSRLVRDFIPTLKGQPVQRLHNVGSDTLAFLYDPPQTDGSIQLKPGVAFCFRKFHPLVQDVVRFAWARAVRSMNSDVLHESVDLADFLFGSERTVLNAAQPVLIDLQGGDCFYCQRKIKNEAGEVDHFVPWAKYRADLAHNLVLADRKCNGEKRHRMPAVDHLKRWCERNSHFGKQITAAVGLRIPCDLPAATRIAHWAYSQTEAIGGLTWVLANELAPLSIDWRDSFP